MEIATEAVNGQKRRVVSGMRSTGLMHLGHLHGALKNWVELQKRFDCFFFIADWHCLTTHYNNVPELDNIVTKCLTEWIACGLDPQKATIFIQSQVPEHSELHLLLSMITPLSWLERIPTYKDQQQKLIQFDLGTYGFLGYPLLQTADVLIYKANYIPVGEDQVPHIEFSREIARRFNYIYGREKDQEQKLDLILSKFDSKTKETYLKLRKHYQEVGSQESLSSAIELITSRLNINLLDKELLLGSVEGKGRIILPEPEALLTKFPKVPGFNGQKMSKSYGNTINLRENLDEVEKKIKTMQTDPARVRRTDPGTPEQCPVWDLHKIYSNQETQNWVQDGCTGAKIGCVDCKKPVIDAIKQELQPIQDEIVRLEKDTNFIKDIAATGAQKAREIARVTLEEVRSAIGLNY